MSSILVLNGPNLNLLGSRETGIYGSATLEDIRQSCEACASGLNMALDWKQSNHEGSLVDAIQSAVGVHDGVILNAGAYTHTSIALTDAIRATRLPVVEVHLSNIFDREPFRAHSYISPVAIGIICGFGTVGYELAITALARHLEQAEQA